jgi:iron complex outermembrane receptor protein
MTRSSVRIGALATALFVAASARPLSAQTGTIQGRVTDSTGAVIVGALFTVDGSGSRAISSSTGRFALSALQTGTRIIRVRALGFVSDSTVVNVVAGRNPPLEIVLTRSAQQMAPIEVVVGSRARHTAAEELAVPVDVFTVEELRQTGTTETTEIVANLAPSVNFPKQAVTDGTEVVRPFTLRGLSPDHSLVLVNGVRRHSTALLNVFSNGSAPGSSGVDLNAFPSSAVERIEVLRDGASTQYGSDAIAGVVNLVLKEGQFAPFVNMSVGQYRPGDPYPNDGLTTDVSSGVGFKVGRGSLGLFAQVMKRNSTNRACPDGSFPDIFGLADSVADCRVVVKRSNVPQPNVHWGDGLERDVQTFANFRAPLSQDGKTEVYAFGGYADRDGTGNGFFRKPMNERNWREIYPLGFLPQFRPHVIDYSAAGGVRSNLGGWSTDLGLSYGYNSFRFNLENTLNSSLGPSLTTPMAPGPDRILGTSDDPGIPNQTSFDAGALRRGEFNTNVNIAKPIDLGMPNPVNVAVGAAFRRESYEVVAGERASWINGYHLAFDSSGIAQAGSSVFQGFAPSDASENNRTNFGGYVDLETNLNEQTLVNVAGRFESYSDFGQKVTAKGALRYQPARQFVLRAAASTGFRAPGLQQSWYSHTTTAIQNGVLVEIGNYPVEHPASRLFGSKALKEESSINLSTGFAWTPQPSFTMTLDYYHISMKDRILLGATFDGTSDSVVARILTDAGITNIVGVQFPTNALDTRTNGVDLTADWRSPLGPGTFDLSGQFNWTKNEITRIDPLPEILQGTATIYTSLLDTVTIKAVERNRPDFRATLTGNYTLGRARGLVRVSNYGSFWEGSLDGIERFDPKTITDVEVGYRFENINLAVGSRNVFNIFPSRVQVAANTNNGTFIYPGGSPFGYNGRFVYVRSEILLAR